MEDIRTRRQREFANLWLESNMMNIMNLCPRFGKIRVAINILEQLNPHCTVLITYPDNKIRHSWEEDFVKRGYNNPNITFTTHLSLKKYVDKIFDIIIIDEIHLISTAQMEICKELFKENHVMLGLTGTLASDTKNWLLSALHLPVVANYSISQAISEGVISDYDITVIKVPLDTTTLQVYKKQRKTEKQQFDMLSYVINKQQQEGRDTMFMRLARMRIIQNSLSKINKTKEILKQYENNRILVFCGITAVADSLDIPSFHSKSTNKMTFQNFTEGNIKHLAVVKIGATGITYKPLNQIIINYFDSNAEDLAQKLNRAMSFEYDNPEKKAHITIICSTESVELLWLKKALEFFSPEKIKYL